MSTVKNMPEGMRRGLLASILFHLTLLLLFLFTSIGLDAMPPQFAEVTLISGSPGGQIAPATPVKEEPSPVRSEEVVRATRPKPERAQKPALQPSNQSAATTEAASKMTTQPARSSPVAPPRRRVIEDEEPVVSHQEQGKLAPGATPSLPGTPGSGSAASTSGGVPVQTAAESQSGGASQGRGGSGSGTGQTSGAGSGQPFTIEGDAAQRLIVKQVIPDYPEGLQRQAVLQFRFTVMPDGRITSLVPMRKGDPVLEEVTLNALRQWRFNPLSPQVEQRNVQGIITFRYELK